MAADRNLEIALRISAELNEARTELDRLNAALDKTGQSSARAGRATREQTAEFTKLLGQIDPTLAALERLDKQQQKLRQAKLAGLVDDEGFARFNGLLEAQRAGLGKAGDAMHSFSLNSSIARRELGLLAKDIATGQWGRLEQSALTLASYSGLLGRAFSPLGIAIGGVTAAIGLFAVAAYQGYEQSQALSKALIATGNYAGLSASELRSAASAIGDSTGRYGDARQAIAELTATGKLSGDTLLVASRAAVDFSTVTGQSIDKAIAEISRLADDPARAIQALDEQYHFLSTSTLQRIQQLQEEGNATQAVALAYDALANTMSSRAADVQQNLGYVERTWNFIKEAGAYWKNLALSLGAPAGDEEKLAELQREANKWARQIEALRTQQPVHTGIDLLDNAAASAAQQELQNAKAEYEKAAAAYRAEERRQEQADQDQQAAAIASQVQAEGNAAGKYIDQLTTSLDRAKQRQDALNKAAEELYKIHLAGGQLPEGIDFNGPLADMPEGPGWEKLKAEIEKRYADPKVKDTSNALAAAQQQLQSQILSLGDNALGPVTAIWDRYTKAMLDAAAAGGKAIKAGGDVAAVQAQVGRVQELAAQARDRALADQQRGLQIAYAQATGDQATAAKLQIEAQYGDLLQDLQRRGDAAGVQLVQSLINVGTARAQLQQLQAEVQRVFGEQQRQEQSIQAQQQAGLISEIDARQQLVDLHKLTADQVAKLIPQMEALAAATGDPAAIERVKDLEAQIQQLQLTTNQFQTTFQQGLESGLTGALEGLVERTMTLREAVLNVLRDIARGFEQLAAQALAQKLTSAVAGLFGGDKTKDVGQGAVKLSAASAVLGGASALLGSNADKLQAAATTLLAANAVGAASGFAEGGYTGPGGKYQVAGVVHRGEGVLSQDDIASIGGPAGFYALRSAIQTGSLNLPGYADGGFVHPLADAPRLPAPAMPRARLPEPAGGGSRAAPVIFRINNIVDPDLVSSHLRSPQGKQDVLNIINANRSAVRQMVDR